VIEFEGVTLEYAGQPALRDVTFGVPEGELLLVVGPTGSGKTSLLRCLDAGLTRDGDRSSPHLTGRVLVDGADLHTADPVGPRPLVGLVRQDPANALGAGTVESVIAGGMPARADDPHAGQRQVEETLDLLGIADLRSRPVTELSGGQQQRVAIGVAVVAGPRVLVLDEPTSALDPVAAEEVLAILHRLVHDVGTTVVVAEHRLERVVHHADAVLLVEAGQARGPLDPRAAMAVSALHPPVVELGLRLGWDRLALSVREARRSARALRTSLAPALTGATLDPRGAAAGGSGSPTAPAVADARRLSLVRDTVIALRSVDLRVGAGEVVALMGRNGSGKSTLLGALDSTLAPSAGRLSVTGTTALAAQDPGLLLSDGPVSAQLRAHDTTSGLVAGTTAALLARLAPDLDALNALDVRLDGTAAELSEGQRMCVALSLVLARNPALLLLDEPTRGLDYAAKDRLTAILAERAAQGCAVVVATHDVELAAEVATRVVVLAEGEVVADGPSAQVLSDSPAFAPQVAKVMHPLPLLRVPDVLAAVEAHTPG
jgi:energy-coupling factor transport system ATP-binding protein